MLTEKQIEDQQTFERLQIKGGLEKLRSNTKKLEEQIYASASVYGSSCVNGILPDLIAYIDEKKKKYTRFAGKDAVVVNRYIVPVDSEIQALLTCKVMFDHVFAPNDKKRTITNTALAVGSAIEAECQMNYYEQEAPALLVTLKKNYWHQAKGTEYKRKCIQTLMHKSTITPWIAWDKTSKIKIGTWSVSYTHLTLPTSR